jgi:hypothetical protein
MAVLVAGYSVLFMAAPKPWRGDWHAFGQYVQTQGGPTDLIVIPGSQVLCLIYDAPVLNDRIRTIPTYDNKDFAPVEHEANALCRDVWFGPLNPKGQRIAELEKFYTSVRNARTETVPVDALNGLVFLHVLRPCNH